MLEQIPAALASIKTFSDFTGFVLQSKVDAAVKEKAIESQAAIISVQAVMLNLQSQYQSLLQEKDELKKQLIETENWNAEASKYSLIAVDPGIFVYALYPNDSPSTPDHWLCTHCYQNKHKSILERTGSDSRGIVFLCFRCQNSIRTSWIPGEIG